MTICYKTKCWKQTFGKSLCEFHLKEYEKTVYTRIYRKRFWPENLISAHPVKIWGFYLWTIYRLAKPNYKYSCSKSYSSAPCKCPLHKEIITQ